MSNGPAYSPPSSSKVRTRETNWRNLVLKADPNFVHRSRIVREYIFSSTDPRTGGPREFYGDYTRRGNYAPRDD